MKDYSIIEYNNNFISQVIIRVDFSKFIETEFVFGENVENEILKYFPNKGMFQIVRYNTLTESYNSKSDLPAHSIEVKEGRQREYISINRKNKLILSNKHIVFEINMYQNYEQIYNCLNPIFDALFSKTSIYTKRVGIRYINILDSEKMPIRKNYFSSVISQIISTNTFNENDDIILIRSLQSCEYLVDEMILCFRYGLYNPQYPEKLTNNSFSLDYDCFTGEVFDTKDGVMKAINKGHKFIQIMFESSITDSLRKVMNNE